MYDISGSTEAVTPGFVWSGGGILEIGPMIDFHRVGLPSDFASRLSVESNGDLRIDNGVNGTRSGNIFTKSINPNYSQPPLCFYQK